MDETISRKQLTHLAKRIVVKVGTAVLTQPNGHLSPAKIGSIVEQIANLQRQGRQMILVSSGSVSFGRKEIQDTSSGTFSGKRAAAAVGQSSLMSFYKSLFSSCDIKIAQVLVTNSDFNNDDSRVQLKYTISELLGLGIVPIINTNDVVEATVAKNMNNGVLDLTQADMTDIFVEDNDSLAAILAAELESNLLIMLSNVDGIFSRPPGVMRSKMYSTFTPKMNDSGYIEYGSKSSSGLGGMQSKVRSALWALRRGTAVVICNGGADKIVERVVQGEKVGTIFTTGSMEDPSDLLMDAVNEGAAKLNSIGQENRQKIIEKISQALKENSDLIIEENIRDLEIAKSTGLQDVLVARLKLTKEKLAVLSDGLNHIAKKSVGQVGRVLKLMRISKTLTLKKVSCPIGVLLVIFESRPDCLPQISALSLATGNGLILKGGKEAQHSNLCLYKIIRGVLGEFGCENAIKLIESRDDVNDLLHGDKKPDLIIPRGSNQLVRTIQKMAGSTPVLGHAEGICHVYIDHDVDQDAALKITVDSKCNYPAACNAMETLLVHESHLNNGLFSKLCDELEAQGVKINYGQRLVSKRGLDIQGTKDYEVEYSSLECTVEIVSSLEQAINHINQYGSSHTDAIVTSDRVNAKRFEDGVNSACVFVNCSTRFSDGYRFGLGAEVGISTSRIHARGPAGMESLLTYKWVEVGVDDIVTQYDVQASRKYLHEELALDVTNK